MELATGRIYRCLNRSIAFFILIFFTLTDWPCEQQAMPCPTNNAISARLARHILVHDTTVYQASVNSRNSSWMASHDRQETVKHRFTTVNYTSAWPGGLRGYALDTESQAAQINRPPNPVRLIVWRCLALPCLAPPRLALPSASSVLLFYFLLASLCNASSLVQSTLPPSSGDLPSWSVGPEK